jgi:SnoaL-like domain
MGSSDGGAGTGAAMAEALLARDAEAMIALLAADATFHSPVTDYDGRERVAEVLGALVQVVADGRPTRRLEGSGTTAVFFEATLEGRAAEGVLLVVAAHGGSVSELKLMVRPLRSLLVAIERMKALLGADERR